MNFTHTGVAVQTSKMKIPTYVIGAENPHPSLFEKGVKRVYPYKRKNSFTEEIVENEYDAVSIDTPWMHIVMLPDWGFHVYRAQDKITGRDMFFCPKVMKPANNAIRGAYIAGGVEFNFPVGHNAMTYDRVELNAVKKANGVSVLFYNVDRCSGMSLTAGITAVNDFRGIIFDQYMLNPTPLPQAWYYWLNAGIAPDKSLSFKFPCKHMLGHFEGPFLETKKDYTFPCYNNVDYSKYSEVPEPIGLFGTGNQTGWFGAWYHDWDFGIGRWAAPWKVGGQKYWSWGNSEEGLRWGKIAADQDFPIPEIQSGRPEVQMDRGILPPFSFTSHREWWMPVSGIGNLKAVSRYGGLNLENIEGHTVLKICPSSNKENCEIWVNGKSSNNEIDLVIGASIEREIPIAFNGIKNIKIKADTGIIMEWNSDIPARPVNVDTLCDKNIPVQELNAESLALNGYHADRIQHHDTAKYFYLKALEKDPCCSKAHLLLGLQCLKSENIRTALKHFENVLDIDRMNEDALYFHGLASLWNNESEQATADFSHTAATGHEYVVPAMINLIREAFVNKDFEKLVFLLEDGLNIAPNNPLLLFYESVYSRLKGDTSRASLICDKINNTIGINLFSRWERHFAGIEKREITIVPEDYTNDHMLITAALNYYHIGQIKESSELLKMCSSDEGRTEADYLLRFLIGSNADTGSKKPVPFFAHGREIMGALTMAIQETSSDLVANFGLGCLMASLDRIEVAEKYLSNSAKIAPENTLVNCTLGRIYMQAGKYELSEDAFNSTISSDELNCQAWIELDNVLRLLSKRDKSWLKRFSSVSNECLKNDEVRKCLAILYCDHGEYDSAAQLLQKHLFHPYELTQELRNLWARIHREKAIVSMCCDKQEEAFKSIKKALEYPHNLQLGKPLRTYDAGTFFAAGLIFNKAGRRDEAQKYFHAAANEFQPDPTLVKPWSVLADILLENRDNANEKLDEIKKQAEYYLDYCIPLELNNDLKNIISLCEKIKKGWIPELEELNMCK